MVCSVQKVAFGIKNVHLRKSAIAGFLRCGCSFTGVAELVREPAGEPDAHQGDIIALFGEIRIFFSIGSREYFKKPDLSAKL